MLLKTQTWKGSNKNVILGPHEVSATPVIAGVRNSGGYSTPKSL